MKQVRWAERQTQTRNFSLTLNRLSVLTWVNRASPCNAFEVLLLVLPALATFASAAALRRFVGLPMLPAFLSLIIDV